MDHGYRFTAEKIAHRIGLIRQHLFTRKQELKPFGYVRLDGPDDDSWRNAKPGDLEPAGPHGYWGEWEADFALLGSFSIPEGWPADVPCALHLPLGRSGDFLSHPEALVYAGGKAVGSADRHHQVVFLPEGTPRGKDVPLAARGWTGFGSWPPEPGLRTRPYMRPCSVVQRHEEGFELACLAEAALETAALETTDKETRRVLLDDLDEAFLRIDLTDPLPHGSYFDSLSAALAALKEGLASPRAGRPLDSRIHAVGHAHIDVAYLWTVGQARAKARRTFANALALMDRHPGFRFTQTTPLLYRSCAEDDPELFARVRKMVDEGRWEATGGMWVEADCNLVGGESLVRQLMLGRRHYDEALGGKDSRILFLPDTFGFCASLPQLIEQAGLAGFAFSKLNWNQATRFLDSFFWWEGIDGTRVFSHLLTTPRKESYLKEISTYKAVMSGWEVSQSHERNTQGHKGMPSMIAYGYGDGGGGPTDEQVCKAGAFERMPSQPRMRLSRLDEFMEHARETAPNSLPVHEGELYLQLHRGTYTSQAKLKRANRKLEAAVARTEFLACVARMEEGADYPREILREAWEALCTNQFHDVLPGSSVAEVNEQAMEDYAKVGGLLDGIDGQSLGALARDGEGEAWALVNGGPIGGHCMFELEGCRGKVPVGPDGKQFPSQPTEGGLFVLPFEVDWWSVTPFKLRDGEPEPVKTDLRCGKEGNGWFMENNLVRVEVGADGALRSVMDKARGELLAEGRAGNELVAYEDRPIGWDAWDIDPFYEEKQETVGGAKRVELVEEGPLRATVLVERSWRSSTIEQRISLYPESERIDFDTKVDWHESHVLLKAAFPVAITAEEARYHVPFGHVKRTTSREYPGEWAQFEVPAHYWACVWDPKKGVALLNDCKYGHDIAQRDGGTLVRLTLVKSATLPDPNADQGMHEFRYSLLPVKPADLEIVIAEGYLYNRGPVPVRLPEGKEVSPWKIPVHVEGTLLLETVKQAEDGSGVVLRYYESFGWTGEHKIVFGKKPKSVRRVTILERDAQEMELSGGVLKMRCRPFEIVTLIVDWS